MPWKACPAAVLFLGLGVALAWAQNIPREEYLRYVPLEPMSIRNQTTPNVELRIFGDASDPEYRDVSPRDGIDDARGRVLGDLAVRFAPIMVLNTTNFPVDHRWYAESGRPFPLVTDRWDVSGAEPVLTRSDSLEWGNLGQECTERGRGADCRLLDLLGRYHPESPEPLPRPGYAEDPRWFEVLFFDFPGEDEASWRAAFDDAVTGDPAAAEARLPLHYVHPFVARSPWENQDDSHEGDAYQLVLQYWFFYPYNDGGNNHEGDWEHINVVVGPRSLVGRALTADEVSRILDGGWSAGDPLVLHRVEYYFHHKVMVLDYSDPDAYQDRDSWKQARDRIQEDREGRRRLAAHVRRLAFEDEAETRINTHPVVFVGADNKGTDQILSPPGGKNRDSHGSYPIPGLYKDIGPAGATEQIGTTFDHVEWFAAGGPDAPLRARRGEAISFARPERVRIVPDWERVLPLVETEGAARRDWGWLVLPIRWGYPASESPFAGLVEHAETGNLSVPGPAFNAGWNRLGTAPGFSVYEPHMLYSLFPLGWQDNFQNDLGFLNLTYPSWIVIPPLDFAWRILSAPYRLWVKKEGPIFYPKEDLPHRFFGVSAGTGYQTIPDRFADLFANKEQFDEYILTLALFLLAEGDSTTRITGLEEETSGRALASFQLVFFIGDRFSSENTLNHTLATFTQTFLFSNAPPFRLDLDLNLWDYQGTFRWALRDAALSPYAKFGYGVSWYRLENGRINGMPMVEPRSPWTVRLNGNAGAGAEWILARSRDRGIPGGFDLAVRGEWQILVHRLGLDETTLPLDTLIGLGFDAADIPRNGTVARHQFVLRAVLTF